ncbi:MAG: glycosyltransferase family 4 protein, partial [Clostridia bacterium]|nr:glycosyltransferase family 4 protein [Clostridia bacterium]
CSDLPPRPLRRFPLRLFSGLHLRVTADAAIATDESAALALIYAGMPAKKIRLIYNGAPPVRETSAEERALLRGSLGIPENALCVGLFSRLEPIKGALQFVQAAAVCLARTDNVRFLVCGKGSLEKEMRQMADRFGIAGKIVFAGYAEDVAPYMNLCKIIDSPSLGTETSSLSLCEGMSAGLVPVVTDVGGNARLADGCGKTVPPDDPPALADAILGLFRDPGLLRLCSEKAVRRYRERYTAQRMAAETHALYLSLALK